MRFGHISTWMIDVGSQVSLYWSRKGQISKKEESEGSCAMGLESETSAQMYV
jgi:hypothetical protein